jgi:hypothetical protein
MTELFSNLGQTSINQIGGIGATDTTVVVAALNGTNSADAFPSSGNFRLVFGTDINSEIVLCTAVNPITNTFTIVRGQEGTTAQAWVNGTAVAIILTAQAINQARADLFQVGPYSNKPTQGLPTGSYYQAIDGHTPWVWENSTSQWRPSIQGVLGLQPPAAATFSGGTLVNSPNSIVDTGRGALDYTGPSDAANTVNFHGYTFSFPTQTGGFVETSVQNNPNLVSTSNTWQVQGACLRESSSGKIYVFSHASALVVGAGSNANSNDYLEVDYYSSPTSRTSVNTYALPAINSPAFLRIRWDTQNVYADYSRDRIVWLNLQTNTLTSVFTTKPDQIGFGGFSAGLAGKVRILHYTYGAYPVVSDQVFTANVHNIRPQIFMPLPNLPPTSPPTGWIGPIFNH